MRKIFLLLLTAVYAAASLGQSATTAIDPLLAAIDDFQSAETKRDSLAGHWLGSAGEVDFLRRYRFYDSVDKELDKIITANLSFDEQLNLKLLKYSIEDGIASYQFKAYLNPILADEGFHTSIAALGMQVLTSRKDFEDYIKQLRDIPRYIGENLSLMRTGLKLGICQPRSILTGYENTYEQHIVTDPEKSVFWQPFARKPFGLSDADWKELVSDGRTAIMQYAVEGFRSMKIFFDKEYLPRTRTTIGVSHFPDGLKYYQAMVHLYTTTDLSYDEVYEIGLKEVARIHEEMLAVMKEAAFRGNLAEFIAFLRTDPKFYASTATQLLKEASWIAKQADGMLPKYFGKLPRQPYGVAPVPAHLAPTYTAGRYAGASVNSRRAALYWVNTYELKSRPLYALESLTLHEAVPGHHLQIALAQELTNLPGFRKNLYVNAFGEGWGLYGEYLGTEMGFYKDPYSHFGRLTYEMWRACRLVIDVGLHTKDWTRQQAVDYLAGNTALSLHEVNTEINRYISWPGQALAYKIGELKIKELRKRAEDRLRERFDIREFHDTVLSQGSVTLEVLEQIVDRYLQEKLR